MIRVNFDRIGIVSISAEPYKTCNKKVYGIYFFLNLNNAKPTLCILAYVVEKKMAQVNNRYESLHKSLKR